MTSLDVTVRYSPALSHTSRGQQIKRERLGTRLVVDKKYVPADIPAVLKQEPVVLPALDPMGSLACVVYGKDDHLAHLWFTYLAIVVKWLKIFTITRLYQTNQATEKTWCCYKARVIDDKNGDEGIFLGARIAQHSKRTQVGWAQFLYNCFIPLLCLYWNIFVMRRYAIHKLLKKKVRREAEKNVQKLSVEIYSVSVQWSQRANKYLLCVLKEQCKSAYFVDSHRQCKQTIIS